MFDNIAHAYDKLNHTLSLGIDRSWRRKAIAWLRPFHPQRMMDVATGTGDFAILACRELQPAELIGTDISEGMMNVGREKVKKEGLSDKISFAREDCTSLSFADNDFDAITVAFGIRNFEDLDKGLSEMCRVLKPGGHLVILELTTPERFPMKQLFSIYSKIVIPLLGKLPVSYTHLRSTCQRIARYNRLQLSRFTGCQRVEPESSDCHIRAAYTKRCEASPPPQRKCFRQFGTLFRGYFRCKLETLQESRR